MNPDKQTVANEAKLRPLTYKDVTSLGKGEKLECLYFIVEGDEESTTFILRKFKKGRIECEIIKQTSHMLFVNGFYTRSGIIVRGFLLGNTVEVWIPFKSKRYQIAQS